MTTVVETIETSGERPLCGGESAVELPARIAAAARITERAGLDAARIGTDVGIVLAAEAAAGVGLWAAFTWLVGLRASRALAAAARGAGES